MNYFLSITFKNSYSTAVTNHDFKNSKSTSLQEICV